ncbi:hypothetical protein [Arundinibacter roseus]|uniref:Uncharacterized protein n=1 Tax=Arundinibacter roseus TaxID=2070510 RepID=A0A4R4JVL7_9BACT|nr:hypothetical protein [Arundinibacter roseus]TDB58106.1 hypothetical protein EZE20_23395 [Arundinibacter roseus]
MKTLLNYLLMVAATALLQLFMPWWTIALVPFVVYLLRPERPLVAYATSLAAIATVWMVYAIFLHTTSGGSMSDRVAQLFFLPNGGALVGTTTLLSGLVAGFAGLAGHYIRSAVVSEKQA